MKIWPFPELLDEEDWDIEEGQSSLDGKSNIKKHKMVIPTLPTLEALTTRSHEMSHVRFTPDKPMPQATSELIPQAVEDFRIGRLGKKAGITYYGFDISVSESLRDVLSVMSGVAGTYRQIAVALSAFAMLSSDCLEWRQEVLNAIPGSIKKETEALVTGVETIMEETGYAWSGTVAATKWLNDRLKLPPHADIKRTVRAACGKEGEEYPEAAAEITESYMGDPFQAASMREQDTNPWGQMTVAYPKLVRSIFAKGKSSGRRRRALEEGAVPVNIHRLLTDQRIFSWKHGLPGGTMLIDRSGSMGLNPADVHAFVAARPRVIVADYSGGRLSASKGTLRILARRGRWASEETIMANPDGGGNIIDGPALRWLAGQRPPRIWVSDGGVTGIGDHQSEFNVKDAKAICVAAGVIRVNSIPGYFRMEAKGEI